MIRTLLAAALLAVPTVSVRAQGLGLVYTLTNDAADNEVAVAVSFRGQLLPFARFSTGGTGTAAGLGSQGALALSRNGRTLLAVNPGSDDLTLFDVAHGLVLWQRDVAPTGDRPTSVAIHGDLVYALNADSDDLSGFRIVQDALVAIGSFPLSQAGAAGAQVGFDPTGRFLIATERATNRILAYPVMGDGTLGTPMVNPSAAPTPFGFEFRSDGVLIVSEAAGGMANASAVSSYALLGDGTLRPITAPVQTMQTAACWIAIPRNGRFAYTTNTASGSITGFSVHAKGQLGLLEANGVTASLGSASPIDLDFNRAGDSLFVLDSSGDRILALVRRHDGSLALLPDSLPVPDGTAGLVAR